MLELSQVILAVPHLGEAKQRFEDLGFTVLDGGRHPGLGTANCIIPLGRDYIELLGVVDEREASRTAYGLASLRALPRRCATAARRVPDRAAADGRDESARGGAGVSTSCGVLGVTSKPFRMPARAP